MTIQKLLITIFTLLIVLLGAMVCSLILLVKTEVEITASEKRRFDSYLLADELRQSSDDLTNMARLFVVSGKERFAKQFQEILDIRSGKQPRPENYGLIYWDLILDTTERSEVEGETLSLEDRMIREGFTTKEFKELVEAEYLSNQLAELETIAMNAVRGKFDDGTGHFEKEGPPDFELARQIMFGDEYLQAKSAIMKPINQFLLLLEGRTKSEVLELRKKGRIYMWISVGLSILAIVLSIGSILLLNKKVLNPLRLVSEATQQVIKGDYTYHIDYSSSNEFGKLVEAFNLMVEKTGRYVTDISNTNKTLEENQKALELEKKSQKIFYLTSFQVLLQIVFVREKPPLQMSFQR